MNKELYKREEELDKEWVQLEILSAKCDVFEKLNKIKNDKGNKYYDKNWLIKEIFGDIN